MAYLSGASARIDLASYNILDRWSLMRASQKFLNLVRRSPHQLLHDVIRFARKSRYERALTVRRYFGIWDWSVPHLGNDRTAYVIGLFGSGRGYVAELMLKNLGKRAKYFRETIRWHSGPTSMIYSGHATIKYVSRDQYLPAETSRIFEAVRSGFADLIFIYRHPLDSLLTNWIWWQTYIRDNIQIEGISQAYKNTSDLCADLEQNFLEFKAFAEGDPGFWAAVPGPRFLSLSEFVEETALYLQCATLTLRLEDFMIDPLKEFLKIIEVMSLDLDLTRLRLAPPKTKPYRYLVVKEKVPRFRNFINELNVETKKRIEKMGYDVGV